MDDINFDELDKAVNSVLQQPSGPPAQNTNLVVDTPSPDEEQTSPDSTQPKEVIRPIVPKRRGQFMDMVHPSSDMTTTAFTPQRSIFPSRQTGSLQPLDPAVVEATPEPASDLPVEETMSETEDAQPTLAPEATPDVPEVHQAEWSDPLDDFGKAEEEDVQTPPEVDHETSGKVAHIEAGFVNDDEEGGEEAVSNSPFIDGTEIEKRPLGAFTEATKEESAVSEPEEALVPAPLPEELAPEVVSVESDDGVMPSEAEPEKPIMNHEGMNASISQQYKAVEEPVDNEQNEGHPVFDTKEYHQPLTPPAKRSKASRVGRYLLATLFIIIFGLAAGYVIWAFKLL